VFLCQTHELTRERRGYYRAFRKRLPVICAPIITKNGTENLENILPEDYNPILIIDPEASPRLVNGIVTSRIPTGCFQFDTYSGTEKRIKWSMLYDYAFVFHPGFDQLFQQSGHPRSVCLPHAVEANMFDGPQPERIYDVGWVGNLRGEIYSTRRRYMGLLSRTFRMNETDRYYTPEEMASVYRQSRIVVNISRDDYLADANLRCFEAMASGALLMTTRPSELAQLGFSESVHYLAFDSEAELLETLTFYLSHEEERGRIAGAARALVLEKHTYDNRVDRILEILSEDKGKFFSPARQWDEVEVCATYLHYYAKHLMLDSALRELREMRGLSRKRALRMVPMVGKAFVRALQLSI
jgi:hypothetical protein